MNEDTKELIAAEQGVNLIDHSLEDITDEDALAYVKHLSKIDNRWLIKEEE